MWENIRGQASVLGVLNIVFTCEHLYGVSSPT